MAPQNQNDLSFLPSRDVPGYSDAFLRQYGLNGRGSLPFYRDLARLASGAMLRFQSWSALADAMIQVRGDDRGLRHKGRIDDKLQQLRKQGLIAWAGPHSYEIALLPPDQWRPRESAERDPELRVLASCERQGSLFEREDSPAVLGIFEGEKQQPETESAFGFQESAFPEKPKALSVLPAEPHTSYTRAPGVESSRLDESTETNSKEISQEELTEAQHAWLRTRAMWRAKGVTHRIRGADGARNVQAFLKAAILLGRGQLAEAVYAAAASAPVLAAKITDHPFALVWTEWKRDARFKAKIAQLQLPSNWDEGLRNAPQRE